MESISLGDWITIFFGVFTTLSAVVFALIKNHVLLQEHSKKLEVLFQLVNSLKDKTK